jgi:hypothetical protein
MVLRLTFQIHCLRALEIHKTRYSDSIQFLSTLLNAALSCCLLVEYDLDACFWLSSSVVLWMHNCASFWQIVFTTRLPSFMSSTWHFHAIGFVFGEVYDFGSVLDCWKIIGLITFPRFLCPGSLFGVLHYWKHWFGLWFECINMVLFSMI